MQRGAEALFLAPLAAALGLALLLAGRQVRVTGWSMYPLLRHGDLALVETLSYRLRRPRRGEVALARLGGRPVLKLIAALPGDTVAVAGGRVWVNGQPLELTGAQGEPPPGQTLPPGRYFLLSLATDVGLDSRHHGVVTGEAVVGRAWLALWPPRRLP
jgi:signal peptidase I